MPRTLKDIHNDTHGEGRRKIYDPACWFCNPAVLGDLQKPGAVIPCNDPVKDTNDLQELQKARLTSLQAWGYGGSILNQPGTASGMRHFDTGACRNVDVNKLDYEGFLSPLVVTRFAEYMHKHRTQSDGKLRSADNWQKGMPRDEYMKSAFRHFMNWWTQHDGYKTDGEDIEEAVCALIFNAQGYLHERMKERKGYVADEFAADPLNK